jgi:hypothetical protein
MIWIVAKVMVDEVEGHAFQFVEGVQTPEQSLKLLSIRSRHVTGDGEADGCSSVVDLAGPDTLVKSQFAEYRMLHCDPSGDIEGVRAGS